MENGLTPTFFRKTKKQTIKRTRLLVIWDFAGLAARFHHVPDVDAWIRAECERRFSTTTQRTYKAFVHATKWPSPFDPSNTLQDRGWRVWEEGEDIVDTAIDHCKSDCGHDPSSTILVLVARDGDYAQMINEIKSLNVRVYLFGFGCSQELVNAVGGKRYIELPWPDNSPRLFFDSTHHPWLEHRAGGWT
jgi:hypothetical protein